MSSFRLNKKWILIIVAFVLARVFVFSSFWEASADKGGWNNFYRQAQPVSAVMMKLFHDFCDWHPPLYYAFTSIILLIFNNQWFIYSAQILLALLVVWLSYKIAKLFFSEKIAVISAFLVGIEPYWAWHNFLLVSENLFTPLFMAGFYYFFVFIKNSGRKHFYISAIFLGFATLTRPNTVVIIPALLVLLLIIFFLKKKIKQEFVLNLSLKQFIFGFIIFNVIFFGIIFSWTIRNKMIYGQATLANILSTNFFFYNLPPLISMQKNISYSQAYGEIIDEAKKHLREPIDDQGDCKVYSKEEFVARQDYYKNTSKDYIFGNLMSYVKVHLVKTMPFFFQSGYFEMWSAYSGEYSKPDITALILKKDISAVKDFFKQVNAKLLFYILGMILWGTASFAAFFAVIYSYFKDREKFLLFLITFSIILLNALLMAPFILARYRLPINILFFIPLVYLFFEIVNYKFKPSIKE